MSYVLHQAEFEPVVKIFEKLLLIPQRQLFRVEYIEPIPLGVKDFGAVTAASVVTPGVITDQKFDVLEMATNELLQLRFAPIDDVALRVSMPAATKRFLTEKVVHTIPYEIWGLDPKLQRTEIYVFEDSYPVLDVLNPTYYAQTTSRVVYTGYRMVLAFLRKLTPEEIDDPERIREKYTVAPTQGRAPKAAARGR